MNRTVRCLGGESELNHARDRRKAIIHPIRPLDRLTCCIQIDTKETAGRRSG
jgi:hypothetical protein